MLNYKTKILMFKHFEKVNFEFRQRIPIDNSRLKALS